MKTSMNKAGEGRRQAIDFRVLLCAALLRSFRGQHNKKWFEGSSRGNWDPRECQQPFQPNPNGVGDRTTTLRRLLTGAVVNWSRSFSQTITIVLRHVDDVII